MESDRVVAGVSLALWIAAAATLVGVICRITDMGVLPLRLSIAVFAAYGAGLGVMFWFLRRKKTRMRGRIVCCVLSALLIAANIVALNYSAITTDFLEEQYEEKSVGTLIEYSIVAQKEDAVTLPANTSLSMGIEGKDLNYDKVREKVEELTPVAFKDIDGVSEMIQENEDGVIKSAVMRSVILDGVRESIPESYERLEVLATFTIEGVVQEIPPPPEYEKGNSFILYISGIDTYGSISNVGRSDVNILAAFDPDSGRILLVNTPRDYYVQLHGTTGTPDKLTHAGTYGVEMSVQTLEDLYDIDIGYYVRINFDSLEKIVDALGGIEVDSPFSFTSKDGYRYQKGANALNGAQALSFARERKALADGDKERGRNQQRVISAIIKKVTSPSVIVEYPDILEAVSDSFKSNMPPDMITSLFSEQLEDGKVWDIESISVDGEGASRPTYTIGSQRSYVMIPDMETVEAAQKKIAEYTEKRIVERSGD
jgi:LCP family protein required for cell wall assembly